MNSAKEIEHLTENLALAPNGISHTRLLENNRPERRRFLKCVRKAKKIKVLHFFLEVEHEADNSCCEKEPFNITQERIIQQFRDAGQI